MIMNIMYCFLACMLVCLISCNSAEKQARRQFIADSIAQVEAKNYRKAVLVRMRLDSIQRAQHIDSIKHSIKILEYYLSSPNSVGGVDAHFEYQNLNDKTIKYLSWYGYPINAVGDPVTCSIRGYSEHGGQSTGPVEKWQTGGLGYWECMWYNYEAKKLILTRVEIEYMDGSRFTIKGNDLYLIGKKR